MKHLPNLDRAAHLRGRPEAIEAAFAHPEARFAPVWRGKSLVLEGERGPLPAWPRVEDHALVGPRVFLGHDEAGHPLFAIDVSATEDPAELGLEGRFVDLMRAGWKMSPEAVERLGYGRGMLHWHRSATYCAACGSDDMRMLDGGFKRVCGACGTSVFPRTDPAMMILVTHEDRVLLARQARFPPGMLSALAGFVEPGESLEQCVVRETKEEVGLDIERPVYLGSQPWPFPQSLMIGFRAEATSDAFVLDEEELEAARWVSREELRAPSDFFYPPPMSLAHHLIQDFLSEKG